MKNKSLGRKLWSILIPIWLLSVSAAGQSAAFTYQGKLSDAGSAPTGTYQMEFRLFDALSGGALIGNVIQNNAVSVTDGVFNVSLNFGSMSFPGADRFLQVSVRRNANESFVTLNPRQQVASSPYSIRTLSAATADAATNAQQLGGIPAGQYLQANGNGSALTNLNAGSVTTGTINNARLGQIPTANIADNAVTAPKIGGGQVVKGMTVGAATLTDNVTIAQGTNIGITTLGNTVTISSTSGGVGGTGTTNTLPVWSSGTGLTDSVITQNANGVQLPNGVQLAAGAQGNSLALGSPNGETGLSISSPSGPRADLRFDGSRLKLVTRPAGSGPPSELSGVVIDTSGNVGIGTASLTGAKLKVETFSQDAIFGLAGPGFGTGVSGQGTLSGVRGFTDTSGARGVYGIASGSGTGVEGFNNGGNGFGVFSSGFLGTNRLGAASFPNTTLCLNGLNQISACGSSLRYKTDLLPYRRGLSIIKMLNPITFIWRSEGRTLDVGFAAEEVAGIEPLLAISNAEGEVEGIKYDRLSVVFVNAIKEQQLQIENQQKQIERQQKNIEMLTKIVSATNSKADICRENKR